MLRSSLCDYGDAYILVSGTIIITGVGADDAGQRLDERNKEIVSKNYGPVIEWLSEESKEIPNKSKDLYVVIPMYNLIGYSNNYSKPSGSLWKYYRDPPVAVIVNSKSFKSKIRTTGRKPAEGNSEDAEIAVPLK